MESSHVCDDLACPPMHEVWPGLYVGSLEAARDLTLLRRARIRGVLSMGADPLPPPDVPPPPLVSDHRSGPKDAPVGAGSGDAGGDAAGSAVAPPTPPMGPAAGGRSGVDGGPAGDAPAAGAAAASHEPGDPRNGGGSAAGGAGAAAGPAATPADGSAATKPTATPAGSPHRGGGWGNPHALTENSMIRRQFESGLVVGTRDGMRRLYVELLDLNYVNIVQHFQKGLSFIREELARDHGVLIHCQYGQSRSASMAVAFAMRVARVSFRTALAHIAARRPCISINEGFLFQLQLYEVMLDARVRGREATSGAFPLYRTLDEGSLRQEAGMRTAGFDARHPAFISSVEIVESDGKGAAEVIDELPETVSSRMAGVDRLGRSPPGRKVVVAPRDSAGGAGGVPSEVEEPAQAYACGTCRQPLFHSGHLVPHVVTGSRLRITPRAIPEHLCGRAAARRAADLEGDLKRWVLPLGSGTLCHAVKATEGESPGTCGSYYVEPMAWMSESPGVPSDESGRIVCPNPYCGAKLGRYSWVGFTCPCGKDVAPGFAVQRGKVVRRPYAPFEPEARTSAAARAGIARNSSGYLKLSKGAGRQSGGGGAATPRSARRERV